MIRFDQWRAREKHLTSYLTTTYYIPINFWQTKTNKMTDHEINHDERFLFLTLWFGCPSNRKVEEWVMEQFWKKLKRYNTSWAPTMFKYSRSSSTFLLCQVINTRQQQRPAINTRCSQMVATEMTRIFCCMSVKTAQIFDKEPLVLHEITLWTPFRERIKL